jgi:hypothetical protein
MHNKHVSASSGHSLEDEDRTNAAGKCFLKTYHTAHNVGYALFCIRFVHINISTAASQVTWMIKWSPYCKVAARAILIISQEGDATVTKHISQFMNTNGEYML